MLPVQDQAGSGQERFNHKQLLTYVEVDMECCYMTGKNPVS